MSIGIQQGPHEAVDVISGFVILIAEVRQMVETEGAGSRTACVRSRHGSKGSQHIWPQKLGTERLTVSTDLLRW